MDNNNPQTMAKLIENLPGDTEQAIKINLPAPMIRKSNMIPFFFQNGNPVFVIGPHCN